MENLARKNKILQVALDSVLKTNNVSNSDITYIGDEVDDFKACQELGISFIGCTWGNRELEQLKGVVTISFPNQLLDILHNAKGN